MNRPAPRTTACSPDQARTRRRQSAAFVDVAEMILHEPSTQEETHVAAALAVLAAIAASDAVCGIKLGRYARGSDHQQAVKLLESVDLSDGTLPAKFRRVLSFKDDAHYSAQMLSKTAAQAIVANARALVDAAGRI